MKADFKGSPGTRQRDIFLNALEKSDPVARAAFLDGECGRDSSLRQRVEELLREEEGMGGFMETPALSAAAAGPGGTLIVPTVTEKAGDRINRYKLLQKIGEGGCG